MTRTRSSGILNACATSGAHAERTLRAGPHGDFVAGPLGHRGTRLERDVRDVRNAIARRQRDRRRRARGADVAGLPRSAAPAAARALGGRCLEVLVDGRRVRLHGRRRPFTFDQVHGAREHSRRRRDHSGKISVDDHLHAGQRPRGRAFYGLQFRTVRVRAKHPSVQHSRTHEVRRERVAAGHDVARR